MRNYRREDQLSGAITRELSDLIRTRMKDPRIGFASITGVELSHDLRYAKVFVSVMGSPEEQRETMRGLDSANGFLRRELAQRLTIRHVPEISFRLDESIARGARVLDLLKQVEQESAVPVSAENAGDESD
ncbi:MAG TPA: 30S ribosome-binding factor RbfA [Ktedonobacterales bacterium]|jgi:ribosome-binding factor A|nr:30S ribosome-binding factor RbfA [Ktedonobacterales bacterium]